MGTAFAEWARVGLLEIGPFQWRGREPYSVIWTQIQKNRGAGPFDLTLMRLDKELGSAFSMRLQWTSTR